ncbi:hypothetical protein [Vibrio vulnificus YJ016]|uniref:Uncharacterized protein n=1 Tax=Vibrio vulnificus (strain YJ016) TaxID=196600 RepID=Q7ME44_VIBVY|nr:hypothetical protein [Vibrio vulnificus]BAC96866.1 hypothetical protein [Vibrio vulnificus YJ016]
MSQELVNSVNKLTDETSALLQEYVKGNTVLQNSASEAASSAAAAKVSEGITIDKANVATQKAAEAKQFRDETAAVATGGTATLDPTPGKIPLANAEAKIHAGWLPVNVSALSEAIVEAIRDVNKEQYAASGFIHDGKHFNSGNLSSVNEGMTVDIGTPNVIYLGARDGVTGSGLGGTSATNYPVMNVAGFEVHLQGINASLTNLQANTIKLPEATNGTVVSDSSGSCRGTGKPTLDLSKEVDPKYGDVASSVNEAVARAFEGSFKNGDFRKGKSDWSEQFSTTYTVTNGVATVTCGNNSNGRIEQFVAGSRGYVFEVVVLNPLSNPADAVLRDSVGWTNIPRSDSVQTIRHTVSSSSDGYVRISPSAVNNTQSITVYSARLVPATEEVVTDRVDMAGIEFFKRKVGDFLYPYGSPQCGYSEVDGVPTTEDTSRPITYFAAYDGDTTSRGRGWRLSDLTFAQLAVIMSNPKHNAWYNEKGELLQFGPRQRSFAGMGNGDWSQISPAASGSSPYLAYSTGMYVTIQGDENTPVGGAGLYPGGHVQRNYQSANTSSPSWSLRKQTGLFHCGDTAAAAVDGECYFYVLATVPRLNQGAHHPSFNPMGTGRVRNSGNNAWVSWYEDSTLITDKKSCFDFRVGVGGKPNPALSGKIGTNSGRPDGRFYDAIYASGQGGVIDWRLPARDMSGKEEAAKIFQKVVNGTYRGIEKLAFTWVDAATQYGEYADQPWLDIPKSGAYSVAKVQIPASQISDAGVQIKAFVVNGSTVAYATNRHPTTGNISQYGLYLTDSTYTKSVVASFTGIAYRVVTNPTNTSVSGDFSTLDVIGSPEQIMATPALDNGWVGRWIPIISTPSINLPLSRKCLRSSPLSIHWTTDNGKTWATGAQGYNPVTNELDSWSTTNLAVLNYTAFAKQTKSSVNKPVLNGSEGVGDVWNSADSRIDGGVLLGESMLEKVFTNSLWEASQNVIGLTSIKLVNDKLSPSGSFLKHSPLELSAPENNSPAVKALWYQVSNNQQATLNFLWSELIFDTSWRTPDKVWSGGSISVAVGETFRAESSSAYAVAGLLMRCVKALTANASVLGAMHVGVGGDVISLTDGQTYFKVVNNGWSDDSTIRIIDGVGTFNNENGDTCLYGTDELAMPYGYTQNQAGAGKQVVGVDL